MSKYTDDDVYIDVNLVQKNVPPLLLEEFDIYEEKLSVCHQFLNNDFTLLHGMDFNPDIVKLFIIYKLIKMSYDENTELYEAQFEESSDSHKNDENEEEEDEDKDEGIFNIDEKNEDKNNKIIDKDNSGNSKNVIGQTKINIGKEIQLKTVNESSDKKIMIKINSKEKIINNKSEDNEENNNNNFAEL